MTTSKSTGKFIKLEAFCCQFHILKNELRADLTQLFPGYFAVQSDGGRTVADAQCNYICMILIILPAAIALDFFPRMSSL